MFNTETNTIKEEDMEIIDNKQYNEKECEENHKKNLKDVHKELFRDINFNYIYSINLDGESKFYFNNRENAIKKMWKIARDLQFDWMNLYNCYICENNNKDSEISIFGTQKNCIITYDRRLHHLKVEKVFKIKNN